MYKNDKGYIVVETVGAFVPFMLLVVSILSLINIITFQVRMHYALTQTAETLSMYCYVLEAAGVADELSAISSRGSDFASTMEDILAGVNALGGGGSLDDAARGFDAAETAVGEPVEMIRNFANYGLDGIRNAAASALAEPLVLRYLTYGGVPAADYFRRLRVIDFDISECAIIDGNDDVRITADYRIEYTFGILSLPGTPTLRLRQSVVTKAWLGGNGVGYGE